VDRAEESGARYDARASMELSFIVALQSLPPRQRAVLVLGDVLGFEAAEIAGFLDTSEWWVERALDAARAALLGVGVGPGRERTPAPGSPEERELVDRFTSAFMNGDAQGVAAVLTRDAWAGAARFFATARADRFRLVRTRANTQPALACYLADLRAPLWRAYGLMVLTLDGERIAAITGFPDTRVFQHFGLPRTLHG
jgi:RNA polymerase sigma-70 factor (ECF subfamily)